MESGAAAPTCSLELVAQEDKTKGVLLLLQALAVATSPSGAAILWKAVEVTQMGELILVPKISVSVPFHLDESTKVLWTIFRSLNAWY